MNSEKRAELKAAYKLSHRPVGVYQIKNTVNGKIFIGSSLNIEGRLNRHRFGLTMGNHDNKKLQDDVKQYGIDKFSFEVLECLDPSDDMNHDYSRDLEALESLWLEKLQPYGDNGYN